VEFTERMVRQQGLFEAQRRVDLESMGTRVGRVGDELLRQRQASEELARALNQKLAQPVSQQRP
jgi:hypothetical protein